jgi:hypothetical protein
MPVWACFSYSADLPPNVTSRRAAQRAPRGSGRVPGYPCFSYPLMCFSYPADVVPGTMIRDDAQPASPAVRRMPYGTCFRY